MPAASSQRGCVSPSKSSIGSDGFEPANKSVVVLYEPGRSGSAALDLCWVAAGRVDGFWEWKLKPWDTAAGALLVEEAGGRVSDFRGARFDAFGEQTLASNGGIHVEMLASAEPEVLEAYRALTRLTAHLAGMDDVAAEAL